jgi:hypothetical protein
MRKHLSLFIVCLLFFSFVTTALHNHSDGGDHADCPICIVSHHQATDCFTSISLEYTPVTTQGSYLLPPAVITVTSPYTPANNRAPPA